MAEKDLYTEQMNKIQKPLAKNGRELTDADKKKLSDAYLKTYDALVMQRMLQGTPMGPAMYDSMRQVREFISAQNVQNPVTMYLRQLCASHNAKQSFYMMSPQIKDSVFDCPVEQKAEYTARASKDVNSGIASIKSVATQFKDMEGQQSVQDNAVREQNLAMKVIMNMAILEQQQQNTRK